MAMAGSPSGGGVGYRGGRLVGDYMFTRQIGSGSFSVVWLARHRLRGTEFAVKEIVMERLNKKLQDSLRSEISILKRINHPNIVTLHDIIEASGRIYLILEYCRGGDLSMYIQRHGSVPEPTAKYFMLQLAAGLQVLREYNLIHRDLKPQNLLLSASDDDSVLKIADFGFARSLQPRGLAETLCGSPLYMAPEIMQSQKYDAKADLWSVGAILFQLVTGRPPFTGNSQVQLLQNIMKSNELRFPPGNILSYECMDLCRRLLRRNPGYAPPSFDRLRTTLLAQEKEHVKSLLQPIKDTWKEKGVSIVSDGWTDRQRRPLINIMAVSSAGTMFIKAIDSSGCTKDADYVADVFMQAIKEVGEENIVQIITDNASNYKAAGLIIEAKYPTIFWTPCVVHSLNLALKSICAPTEKNSHYVQCKWISDLINEVQNIRNFVVNHSMALFIFNKYSKLALLRVADTRFASSIIMCIRLKEVRSALERMVMDVDWKVYRGDGSSLVELKAREVKACIVSDSFWDKVDYLINFTEPILDMLRLADTDAPVLHLIYDMWDSMIENVKKVIFEHNKTDEICGKNFFDVIHQILETRWNKSNTPLHCMAHSLVPKYYSNTWLQGGSNGSARIAPHQDKEVSINRSKCFKQLFRNSNDLQKVYVEYGAFSSGSNYFSEPHVIEGRMYEEPISWWANHGASTPLLQALAFKLLGQPASSSSSERNWSTYSMIQSIKRSRLATQRVEDLVFVHCNLRLLSRKSPEYQEGATKEWDIGGDEYFIDGEEIESSEFGAISIQEPQLHEPQIENMIFEEDDDI